MQTDALTDVLKTIRLRGESFFCNHFEAPWGFDVMAPGPNAFHVVVSGQCWLHIHQQEEAIRLYAGDIVAFPTGGGHSMADSPQSPRISGGTFIEQTLAGSSAAPSKSTKAGVRPTTQLLCGAFHYQSDIKHPLLTALPCHILLRSEEVANHHLGALITSLAGETELASPGSSIIVDRLTEVLFVQLLRAHLGNNQASAKTQISYFSALSDPHIGKALDLIHKDAARELNVSLLASEVGLSRSAFSDKFMRLVGQSAKTYLTDWRMEKAKQQLLNGQNSMIQIAEDAAYQSEAAFSKAFKKQFNVSPGKLRRENS